MAIFSLKANRPLKFVLSLCFIIVALVILREQLRGITFAMVIDAIRMTPAKYVWCSLIATLISFAAMGGNEIIAVHTLKKNRLPWRVPLLAGMAGNAFANTIGFPGFTISAWRYRVYTVAGLTVRDITGITAIAFMGIIMGYWGTVTLCALFAVDAIALGFSYAIPLFSLGVVGLLLTLLFLVWIGIKRRRIGLKQWFFSLPDAKLGGLQFIIGMIDLSAAIFAAYILLPAHVAQFTQFAIFYVGALLLGIASQAPAGIGVFEAGIITALAVQGRADVVAALLLFRLIYTIIPFCIACFALAYRMPTST